MMTEDQNETLIRIDERVGQLMEAKLIGRVNRIEGIGIATIAILTLLAGIGIYNHNSDKPMERSSEIVHEASAVAKG